MNLGRALRLSKGDVLALTGGGGKTTAMFRLANEAAAQGWGIALGRIGFIETDIAAGRLVTPFPTRLNGERRWVLLSARNNRKPPVSSET